MTWLNQAIARAVFVAVAGIVALVCVLVAVAFLFAAAYLELVHLGLTPAEAAASVAGFALLCALLTALIARWRIRRRRPLPPAGTSGTPADSAELAFKLGGAVAEEAVRALRARPYQGIGIALLAGIAVGFSPSLRRLLFDRLRR